MSNLRFSDDAVRPVANNRFRKDRANGKVFGVCAGIANWVGCDAMLVRILFVIGTLLGFGSLLLVYLGIALIAD